MEKFKRLPIFLNIVLLTGLFMFTACNDKEEGEIGSGADAAEEYCGCLAQAGMNTSQITECEDMIYEKYIYSFVNSQTFLAEYTAAVKNCPNYITATGYYAGFVYCNCIQTDDEDFCWDAVEALYAERRAINELAFDDAFYFYLDEKCDAYEPE